MLPRFSRENAVPCDLPSKLAFFVVGDKPADLLPNPMGFSIMTEKTLSIVRGFVQK